MSRVTPEEAEATFKRDGYTCVAPRLGGTVMDCWGRNTIAHVKTEPMMAKRGTMLATICQGHMEDGMRAGYVWVTDRQNIAKLRDYLASFERDDR